MPAGQPSGDALGARVQRLPHRGAPPAGTATSRSSLAVEDNLVKGAAGQAVQNMNLMFGLPETTGLTAPPVMP